MATFGGTTQIPFIALPTTELDEIQDYKILRALLTSCSLSLHDCPVQTGMGATHRRAAARSPPVASAPPVFTPTHPLRGRRVET